MLSQFKFYSNMDVYAPRLTGESGSLVAVLDACLVTGYGSKTPVGWLKPIPNSSGSYTGCWQQPSGSGCVLFVNDAAVNGGTSARTREAQVTGYESILGLTHSLGYPNGTGAGQFPYNGQSGILAAMSGSLTWRKSATADATERPWIMFADAHTMYLFVVCGDNTTWALYMFGDIFSYKPTRDAYKCMLTGRLQNNTTGQSVSFDPSDVIAYPLFTTYPHYMARCWGGGGRSIRVHKGGDMGKGSLGQLYSPMVGIIPTPNPVDGAIYMSPVWVIESDVGMIRGRMRGMWFPCHAAAQFGDGQIISGTGELSGKQFQVIRTGPSGGMWAIETGNTVETNDN